MSDVCVICESTENLRIIPIMTGDSFDDDEEKNPVCWECIKAWYESGETTSEGILRYRIQKYMEKFHDNVQKTPP